MPRPQFTADEQFLLTTLQSPSALRGPNAFLWGYLTSGALVAGFAAYFGSLPMMVAAFVVLCGFRIYEECYQARWLPQWRTIIEKYEQALAHGAANPGHAP